MAPTGKNGRLRDRGGGDRGRARRGDRGSTAEGGGAGEVGAEGAGEGDRSAISQAGVGLKAHRGGRLRR